MRKKVFQIVQHLKPGGIETMALDLQKHLSEFDVHIVSLEGQREDVIEAWPRLRPVENQLHFLNKKPGFQISTLFNLTALLWAQKAHAVHTHHIGPLTYGGMAARLSCVKNLVHTEHDAWHLESPKAANLERRLVKLLRPTMVADCRKVAERLTALASVHNPTIIYNGVDTNRFNPAGSLDKITARHYFGLEESIPVIGCAARLEEVKGVSFLISAMQSLPSEVVLVIAGDGSERANLMTQVQQQGLTGRVVFLGRVEAMDRFYKALDLFCLPSLNEGFPLSPLEAQASNIPTIVTDVGGARETLCPDTGRFVAAGDVEALSNALRQSLIQPKEKLPSNFVKKHADLNLMISAYSKILGSEEMAHA